MVEMNKSATELTEAVTNIKVALQVCLRGPVRTYAHCTEARIGLGRRVDALVCAVGAGLCAATLDTLNGRTYLAVRRTADGRACELVTR